MHTYRALIDLLKKGVGIRRKRGVGVLQHGLDALAGSCTKKEAIAFERALKRQRAIDPELWK